MTAKDSRLRDDKIQHAPKRVIMADLFKDRIGALGDEKVAERYNTLTDCISHGRHIPLHFYRRSTRVDDLLVQEGIKHLHLDGGGGDILLFLVEYEDAVVFLEINSHDHLKDDPPGTVLRSLHANCLAARDDEAAARKVMRQALLAEERANLKKGLKPRKSISRARGESVPRGKGS